MQIGDRVEVIGDANDELLGKIGTVTDIVVMDLESAFCPSGWRSATAEDFRRSKLPEPPHFTYSHILPLLLHNGLNHCTPNPPILLKLCHKKLHSLSKSLLIIKLEAPRVGKVQRSNHS